MNRVERALTAKGGVEQLADLLELRCLLLPTGVKVAVLLKGIPATWKATLADGTVVREGIDPDTQLLYGFLGEKAGAVDLEPLKDPA